MPRFCIDLSFLLRSFSLPEMILLVFFLCRNKKREETPVGSPLHMHLCMYYCHGFSTLTVNLASHTAASIFLNKFMHLTVHSHNFCRSIEGAGLLPSLHCNSPSPCHHLASKAQPISHGLLHKTVSVNSIPIYCYFYREAFGLGAADATGRNTEYLSRKNFWVCPFRERQRICERIKKEPYHLLE